MLRTIRSKAVLFRSLNTVRKVAEILPSRPKVTVGRYLAQRLAQNGMGHYFTVPGDYTLALLDEFLKEESLTMVGCCNELNAGYAADGYARATKNISAVMVTYMVGGLSTINAIAGAYSDDLPVLCISGGPNIHDSQDRHLVHHTIGERDDLYQQSKCFAPIVAKTFVIKHPSDAARMIDEAIYTLKIVKKPVYLEIPVNLSTCLIDAPVPTSAVSTTAKASTVSDPITLQACLKDILTGIEHSVKPVLVAGSKLRCTVQQAQPPSQMDDAATLFTQLAANLGCGIAIMPDAKGIVPAIEADHPLFMGRYWGAVSSPHVAEVVESCDLIIMAGSVLNDYTTVGWSALLPKEKLLLLGPSSVTFGGHYYPNVQLDDVLQGLIDATTADQTKPMSGNNIYHKPASLQAYLRHTATQATSSSQDMAAYPATDALSLRSLQATLQGSLTSNTTLLVETGDSWFLGQSLKLPKGASYHCQMQYGSIGWSVGALLGVAMAEASSNSSNAKEHQNRRRVIALIGDGSFQLTAQEVSTMIRYNVKATIILLNNDGYTIEVQIHDGPYNDIQPWNYSSLMNVFNGEEGKQHGNGLGLKARTNAEFTEALRQSEEHDGVFLIECFLNRDDCTEELLEWGSRVAKANGRRNF